MRRSFCAWVLFYVVFGRWEKVAYSLAAFFCVDSVVEFDYVFDFAKAFGFAVFAFSCDSDAIFYHAAEYAGFTVQAKVFGYADAAAAPVKRVCGARFYTDFTLNTNACVLVYGYGSFWIEVFAFGSFEEFLALGFGGFICFLLVIVGKHIEDVNSWSVFLRHFLLVLFGELPLLFTGISFGELLLLIPAEEKKVHANALILKYDSIFYW